MINDRKLFQRSLGEKNPLVQKELFYLEGKEFVLRPEGTANVIQSLLSNDLFRKEVMPWRFYYNEEMFRYERPQKGRYRQFLQFGVELFTRKYGLEHDLEILLLSDDIFNSLGLRDEVELNINFIGSLDERNQYNSYLKNYFERNQETASKLS